MIDVNIPLQIHEEVLERLTITDCSLHFTYIELRVHELTRGLQPSKGKGLTLLRLSNDLIRRLSRPTRQHTVFVGRVLSLLSSVLPLGERSGVNLRGDFNVDNKTVWEEEAPDATIDESVTEETTADETEKKGEKQETERGDEGHDKQSKEDEATAQRISDEEIVKAVNQPSFYLLFWKLQAWFANPSLLFAAQDDQQIVLPRGLKDPVQGGTKGNMKKFRIASRHMLSVFGAVGRREKALAGKGVDSRQEGEPQKGYVNGMEELPNAGFDVDGAEASRKKRKRDRADDVADTDGQEDSFFPKYLTGRNLFEYELRDATFRRHVLAQYLILFQYLLSLTQSQKDKAKEWKNHLLANTAFVLDESDDRWIRDAWKEIIGLMRDIPPEGRVFSDSILQVLKREARWINWKADNCPSIDREPLSDEQIAAFARARKSLLLPMRTYPHTVGTAALSRLWEDGVRRPEPTMRTIEDEEGMEVQVQTDGLDDLEFAPVISSLESYVGQIARLEEEESSRRKELGWEAPTAYHITPTLANPDRRQREKERILRESKDDKLATLGQARILCAWKACRLARAVHMESFAKIKVDETSARGVCIDDVSRLMKAVESKGSKVEQNHASLQQLPSAAVPALSSSSVPPSPAHVLQAASKEADVEMRDGEAGAAAVAVLDDATKQDKDTAMQ